VHDHCVLPRLLIIAMSALAIAACGSSTRTVTQTTTVTIVRTLTKPSMPSPQRTVLPPASIPSMVNECSKQLSIGADGDAGPVRCDGTQLNSLAWNYFAKGNPLVMAIGPNATPDEALEAMCADLSHGSTIPIETSAYELASLYYGWRFGINPSSELVSGGCQS